MLWTARKTSFSIFQMQYDINSFFLQLFGLQFIKQSKNYNNHTIKKLPV